MTIRPWNALLLLLLLMAAGCQPSPPETAVDDLLPVARDPASTCGLARPPEEQARLQPASFVQALSISLPESREQPGLFDPSLFLPPSELVRINAILSDATVKTPTPGLRVLAETALRPSARVSEPLRRAIEKRGGKANVSPSFHCRDCDQPITIQTDVTVCPDFAYEITSVATYKGRQTRMEFVRSNDGLTRPITHISPASILFTRLDDDLRTIGVNLCTSVTGGPCERQE